MDFTFLTAVTIGFVSSTHCVGMCGGIVGAININFDRSKNYSELTLISRHLTYNAGRLSSYTTAGFLIGFIGSQIERVSLNVFLPVGHIIASVFMIGIGFYLFGWFNNFFLLEKVGSSLWKIVQPLGSSLLPAKTPIRVFGLGFVWGWLPCGLVYSVLILSFMTASPFKGALTMIGFGIGTLPMLLAMGKLSEYLGMIRTGPLLRYIAGIVVITFGVYTGFLAFPGEGHHNHGLTHFQTFIFSR